MTVCQTRKEPHMNFWGHYKKVGAKVLSILKEEPKARDSDLYLLARVWEDELGGKNLLHEDIFEVMKCKEITLPESVRRHRQKMQEKYESVRGKTYKKRHRLEKVVRAEINQDE